MPRVKPDHIPTLRLHAASGRAVVKLKSRTHYLGTYGSPECVTAYNELIARWLANGRQLPEERPEATLSVNRILLRYIEHCTKKYASRRRFNRIMSHVKTALRTVREMYGSTAATAFGPRALLAVREAWVKAGLARVTCNQNVTIVKACFRWAVREELLPPTVWHGLSTVEGLRSGESTAPEPKKVKPVPDAHVDAALPFMAPPVQAMVELQRLTGMRAGEVVIMRTCDVDVTGTLWVYKPCEHKTDRHGHERTIYLGQQAQSILRPFLSRELAEYIFRPADAVLAKRAERTANRRTRLSCGNRVGSRKRKTHLKRAPRERYDSESYRRAVWYACDAADRAARNEEHPCETCGKVYLTWRFLARHALVKHGAEVE